MSDRGPESSATPAASGTPLGGIRVLDFSHILAGPFCTRLLADFGADILKVESATRPDRMGATRAKPSPDRRQDRSASFLSTNRSKRSITINLKTEGGRDIATRLATKADVLVENFSAGVMGRLGLDYETLSQLNGGLIYVSMSGYGHSGPRRDWTSMNMNLQAYTGLMMVTGAEGDPPTAISNSWNDYIGGLHACFAILQALAERSETGAGRELDLAQFECSVATIAPLLLASASTGAVPPRLGNRSSRAAPQGCYRSAGQDEWCAISVQSDEQWRRLAQAMGGPAWAADERFGTLVGRLRHHDEIDEHLEAWTSQLANVEVESRLSAIGVPAERMRRSKDVLDSDDSGHVFHQLTESSGLPTTVTGVPFTFTDSSFAAQFPAPRLGEHTEPALQEWLGMSSEQVRELESQNVLV